MRTPRVITLLTDFGGRDPFVGIMKGVILGICRDAAVVDLCHEVPAQDILTGSFILETSWRAFPPGTIHVAVVDPGVGGPRRAILAEAEQQCFIAPDNGLLSYPLASETSCRVRQLSEERYWRHPVSASFHGRDIFAPVAAHLATGVDPALLGPMIHDPVRLDIPQVQAVGDESIQGIVIWVDRFGNCVTNVTCRALAALGAATGHLQVRVRSRDPLRLVSFFAEVPPGAAGALVGSAGYVELFSNGGSFARDWGIGSGEVVFVERASDC